MTDDVKRGPGRPRKPKKPRESKAFGRPSDWPKELPAHVAGRRYPKLLDEAIDSPEFKQKLIELLLDFRQRK
jgi:hypothetical protein